MVGWYSKFDVQLLFHSGSTLIGLSRSALAMHVTTGQTIPLDDTVMCVECVFKNKTKQTPSTSKNQTPTTTKQKQKAKKKKKNQQKNNNPKNTPPNPSSLQKKKKKDEEEEEKNYGFLTTVTLPPPPPSPRPTFPAGCNKPNTNQAASVRIKI